MAFNLNLPLTVFRFISFYFLIITVFVGFSRLKSHSLGMKTASQI
jgi:fatty-acid desaturase